ncbi:hypothetical protein ACR80S_01140 [Halomonas sp. MA07-2]|uniref:hypothetical protein n=1 Tax=Halomonas sp. MA07-2 TaxID=3440841 RepID=UPI003EEC9E6D
MNNMITSFYETPAALFLLSAINFFNENAVALTFFSTAIQLIIVYLIINRILSGRWKKTRKIIATNTSPPVSSVLKSSKDFFEKVGSAEKRSNRPISPDQKEVEEIMSGAVIALRQERELTEEDEIINFLKEQNEKENKRITNYLINESGRDLDEAIQAISDCKEKLDQACLAMASTGAAMTYKMKEAELDLRYILGKCDFQLRRLRHDHFIDRRPPQETIAASFTGIPMGALLSAYQDFLKEWGANEAKSYFVKYKNLCVEAEEQKRLSGLIKGLKKL